jgi:hypothetical protein
MKESRFYWVCLLFLGGSVGCCNTAETPVKKVVPLSEPMAPVYTVVKRIPEMEMYACDDCHEEAGDYNESVRELTEDHEAITHIHPKSKKTQGWCLYCHESHDYNRLRLPSGETISFNESYKLCVECHGNIFDEWEKNIHGKNKGAWQSPLTIYSCTECHDAHDPKFKPIKPMPAPAFPRTQKHPAGRK